MTGLVAGAHSAPLPRFMRRALSTTRRPLDGRASTGGVMSDVRTGVLRMWMAGAALAAVGLLTNSVMAAEGGDGAGPAAKAQVRNRTYIVQLAELPVTAYNG